MFRWICGKIKYNRIKNYNIREFW